MKLLEMYHPELELFVRYKLLDPSDVDTFVESHKSLSRDDYIRVVIETAVYNLRPEITQILRRMEKPQAQTELGKIYNGCVMLNPGFDVERWQKISKSLTETQNESPHPSVAEDPPPPPQEEEKPKPKPKKSRKAKSRKITKAKFLGLESYLRDRVIGQNEAITAITRSLKRSVTGLRDENRPLGVFLFAGASGVGKTYLAQELHSYLFGDDYSMVRIDCGEFQHKHENQKLIGAPPGYVGYDDGGVLTSQMQRNSHTVVLLDEVEKAHSDLWDTFLRVFDEGMITDATGEEISFRDCIIIMTTNLGNKEAVNSILNTSMGFGGTLDVSLQNIKVPPRSVMERFTNKAVRKHFRPEFINRIDNKIVFNHLSGDDLMQIAELEIEKVNDKLRKRGLTLVYDDAVLRQMIADGVNPIEGARGLARVRRDEIEDVVSDALLESARWPRGSVFSVTREDDAYKVTSKRPPRKKSSKASS